MCYCRDSEGIKYNIWRQRYEKSLNNEYGKSKSYTAIAMLFRLSHSYKPSMER